MKPLKLCILWRLFLMDYPASVLAIDHIQTAAVVPVNHDGCGIIHTLYGSFCADWRSLHIIHLHQLHSRSHGVLTA